MIKNARIVYPIQQKEMDSIKERSPTNVYLA